MERIFWELPPETLAEIKQSLEYVIQQRGISLTNENLFSVRETNLSVRAKNVLKDNGIMTITDLKTANLLNMEMWRNTGEVTVKEIRKFVALLN